MNFIQKNKIDQEFFLKKFYFSTKIINISNKKIFIVWTKLYGININYSIILCNYLGISRFLLFKKLNLGHLKIIYKYIKKKINLNLYELKMNNISVLKKIKNYRGWRHIFFLPVRGQRTHTNAKTRKKFRIF